MTFTRRDGDSWDLASSVGMTATMAAAVRAIATRADRPLIDDPFAQPLVRAVGIDFLTRLATGEVPPNDSNDVPGGAIGSAEAMSGTAGTVEQVWIDIAVVRTKFYDEFVLDATNADIT